MPPVGIFSQPLIFTLVAASIFRFLTAAGRYKNVFLSTKLVSFVFYL